MEQYISKAAVIAEIEKRFDEYSSSILKHYDACTEARASELGKILVILNTFEVKEVDLDLYNELDKYIKSNNAFIKDDFVVEKNNGDSFNHIYDLEGVAKYFFELGLKAAQKGE